MEAQEKGRNKKLGGDGTIFGSKGWLYSSETQRAS